MATLLLAAWAPCGAAAPGLNDRVVGLIQKGRANAAKISQIARAEGLEPEETAGMSDAFQKQLAFE